MFREVRSFGVFVWGFSEVGLGERRFVFWELI